ncbi:MAG: DUF6249 domain-containing protein [Pseudomonadales bacterium]|jgi:hypothetical protein|nr:DUF6249 domain-containing protein [Pseudomonadales bacterium]
MEEAIVPVVLFLMIFGIVAIVSFYRFRNRQELQMTIRATLDSGQALSSELLEQLTAALQPQSNDIRRGVILLAFGLAFICLAFLIGDEDAFGPMLGFATFPIFTGCAYLLMGYLRQKSDQ